MSGLEVRGDGLILEHSEVESGASVCVHGLREDAVEFIASDVGVVGDDCTLESEEESSEVINEIVLESSADDITATSEPSELAETGCLCFQNTVSVAVDA